MTYRNGGRGIQLIAMFEGPTSTSPTWARAWTSELDESQPDDGDVWVGQYLGDIKAVRELRADRVVLTAELIMLGGLQGTVTGIGAQGWGANAAASTYGVADRATTTRTYRPGTRDCLR